MHGPQLMGPGGDRAGGFADAEAGGEFGGVAKKCPNDARLFGGGEGEGGRFGIGDEPGRGELDAIGGEKGEKLVFGGLREIIDGDGVGSAGPEHFEGIGVDPEAALFAWFLPGAVNVKALAVGDPACLGFVNAAAKTDPVAGLTSGPILPNASLFDEQVHGRKCEHFTISGLKEATHIFSADLESAASYTRDHIIVLTSQIPESP